MEQAGIPKGVFNVITGDAKAIGEILTQDDRVKKFGFTGSTVGHILMGHNVLPLSKKCLWSCEEMLLLSCLMILILMQR
ncbi:aldehyde dehydrogenase family protein [Histophilus somni]|uniref:aldehyde dehydrogenase family protein n=1 Tax=Histophilus somni TaxID=731 RepID=UPI0000394A39